MCLFVYFYSLINQWKAEASGVPDIAINDCAINLTGLSGSRACEPSRRAGVPEEQAALFVREMKQFCASNSDDAVQTPIMSLETEEEELKDVKIDATLMITSNDSKMNTWFGFVSEGALFLKGNGWDDMDIREVRKKNQGLSELEMVFAHNEIVFTAGS